MVRYSREFWVDEKYVGYRDSVLTLCEGNPCVTYGLYSKGAINAEPVGLLWRQPEETIEQEVELSVIWDAMVLMRWKKILCQ